MLSRRVLNHPFAAPACVCLLVTLAASSITAASVRGAPPHLLSNYDPNVESFRCLDGSKLVPRSRVNDDYCDCLDGSDEPDCCDGTDETKGCKNTCRAAGSAARQDLVSKSKEFAAGAKMRQKYISQSQANKAQWKLELLRVQKDIAMQQGITDQAKAAKEEAEQADKQRREAEAALKKEDEATEGSAAQDSTVKPEDTVNTGSQSVIQGEAGGEDPLAASVDTEDTAGEATQLQGEETTGSPIKAEETVDTGSQHVLKEEADKEEERELTPDEIGRKIASQWTSDPDAAGSGDSPVADKGTVQEEEELEDSSGTSEAHDASVKTQAGSLADKVAESADAGAKASVPDGFSMEAISAKAAAYWDMSRDWINDKMGSNVLGAKSSTSKGAFSGDLTSATDRFVKANGRLHELKKQQTDLEAKLGNDYGLEEALGALVDKCYEAQVDKYTYSVCPFKDAFQKEGSSKTSLGTWAGLADGSSVMKFTGGQACWQGPARSMTVSLKCGSAEKLMKVEEPSRCEYVAALATPAACTPTQAQAVQDQLVALNQELEDDHSEL